MAKFSRALAFAPRPPIVINMPRRSGRRIARRAGRAVGRAARHVGRRARAGLPTTGMVLAAVAVGWGKQKGYLDKLPVIGGSKVFTMGLAGYALRRYASNPHLKNAGLCAMIVAGYDFGRVQAGGTAGDESGDESGEGDY